MYTTASIGMICEVLAPLAHVEKVPHNKKPFVVVVAFLRKVIPRVPQLAGNSPLG